MYANTNTSPILEAGKGISLTPSDQVILIDNLIPIDAPVSASDTGTAGELMADSDYLYVCIATNTWKRVAISTW